MSNVKKTNRMNEIKHTPGPWNIEWGMAQGGEGHHVVDGRDMNELSVVATVHFHDDAEGETKDNAHLIAAAPDLLAALKSIAADAPSVKPSRVDSDNHGDMRDNAAEMEHYRLAQIARAAIAKATGIQL